jgi:hypothetical protein
MFKGDVCRGVALLEFGGYYFDVDLQTLIDFREVLPPDTEFSTVHQATALHASWERGRQRWRSRIGDETRSGLFQAFIAVKPGHPVMRSYLDRLSLHYSGERLIRGGGIDGSFRGQVEHQQLQLGVYAMGEVFSRWRKAEAAEAAVGAVDETFRPSHGVAKVHMLVEVRMADHKHVPEIAAVPPQRGLGVSW